MPLPGLPTLDVFVAIARHGSFRKAALERGVSTSALSHVIRGLERNLGVRLFHRTSRSTRITEAGEHLLAQIGPALGDITAALQQASALGGQPAGTLRLNVPRSAADMVLEPVMSRFLERFPGIRLEIVTQDGFVDIVAEGFDAGIRAGQNLGQEMISVPIGPAIRFAVVGSPGYFSNHETPTVPQDLHGHACVARRYPSGALYGWAFARGGESVEMVVRGRLVVDDRTLIVRAALDGIGLAHIHEAFVAEHIARGALVRVLADWCPALPGFFLYYPGRRQVPGPLRAFIDMVGGKSPPLPEKLRE